MKDHVRISARVYMNMDIHLLTEKLWWGKKKKKKRAKYITPTFFIRHGIGEEGGRGVGSERQMVFCRKFRRYNG